MPQPGLMMYRPSLLPAVIEHAASQFSDVEVVSRETHGAPHRTTYAECARRSRKLANALCAMGLQAGDVVGSHAWNNHRHLEAYYGVSGSGLVMHTCNPRLHPTQLAYVINHADDKIVLFDATFTTLIRAIAPMCPQVRAWVYLSHSDRTSVVEGVDTVVTYEDLIESSSDHFEWPEFDEHTGAALCYTSGTTGDPKGVMYSHRAIVLNALTECLPAVLGLSPNEAILPVVPMFHINARCIPYGAAIAGSKLVLPGPRLDGGSLYELMEAEGVTISAGVPTIWQSLLSHVEQHRLRFSTLLTVLDYGKQIAEGTAAEVQKNEKVTEAYLGAGDHKH